MIASRTAIPDSFEAAVKLIQQLDNILPYETVHRFDRYFYFAAYIVIIRH